MPQPRHTELSILESYLLPPSSLPTIVPYSVFLQLVPTQYRSHPYLKRLYRDLQFQRNVDVDTVRQNIEREVARSVTLKGQLSRRIAAEQNPRASADPRSKKRKRSGRPNASDDQNNDDEDTDSEDNELTNATDRAIDTTYLTSTMHPAHTQSTLPPPSQHHPLTTSANSQSQYHTTTTLISALTTASSTLTAEIADLEAESARLLAEMDETVGQLSDLRYGRFARPVSGADAQRTEGAERTVEDEVLDALEGLERRIGQVVK